MPIASRSAPVLRRCRAAATAGALAALGAIAAAAPAAHERATAAAAEAATPPASGSAAPADSTRRDGGGATVARTAAIAEAEALERLRERLAQKLGATPTPPSAPRALQVTARGAAEAQPGRVPKPARARPAPAAVTPPAAGVQAAHALHARHWDYHGAHGPEQWGRLKPAYAKCGSGRRQSPIDIRDGLRLQIDPVRFDYQPSAFGVVDTGHTVQVNVAAGNSIEVQGRRYGLRQFHFHRPAEERIDGRAFDMVVHLVHEDPAGAVAIVAVLLERGSALPLVQSVWNHLPLDQGIEQAARTPIDLNGLLPAERSYYTYMGSLTTPPCSEGVLWLVLKQPVPVSDEQIAIFARLYPMNARPLQQAAGRMVKASE